MEIKWLRITVRQHTGGGGLWRGGGSLRYSGKQSNESSCWCPLYAPGARARVATEPPSDLLADFSGRVGACSKWTSHSALIAKDPDRSGPMTSSVSCVGHPNELWSGSAPGKMTETFQDVSTETCSSHSRRIETLTGLLPPKWQQVV
jgi:hypothetical protein